MRDERIELLKKKLKQEIRERRFLSSDPRAQKYEWYKCKKSFSYWLFRWVLTMDEHDLKKPFKRFPRKVYLEYIAYCLETYNSILVPKSRQLMVTWICVCYCLWRALFFKAQRVFVQSKKAKDANALIERAKGVFERLPRWMRPKMRYREAPNAVMMFPNNKSIMEGVPQGADQLRSYTASVWLCDEAAFQNELEDTWTAVAPTLDVETCKTILISTANPGFFELMVFDEMTGAGVEDRSAPSGKLVHKGITEWDNNNGFHVVQIHYSADPDRDPATEAGKAWHARERKKYISDARWRKEQEIDWHALSGTLVYPHFDENLHVIDPFPIPVDWTRYMVIDPGLRNPTAALWAAADKEGNVYFYREHYVSEQPVEWHAKRILEVEGHGNPKRLPEKIFIRLIDPAAQGRNSVTNTNVIDEYRRHKVFCKPADNDVDAGINRVCEYLMKNEKTGKPRLFFFRTLRHTIKEINHYRYLEQTPTQADKKDPEEKPIKKADHLMDCLRYIVMENPHYVTAVKPVKRDVYSWGDNGTTGY